jgi:type VI secretion system protein ImpG
MDKLLPYYERELTYLRRLSHDFARRYPKVAGRLLLSGEACDDPHIERLIESFAFLAARIHRKLDDEFPELTDALLQVLSPHYLRPFPSVSIAGFDLGPAAAQLSEPVRIARHSTLDSRPVRGVACRFSSAYELDLWPLNVVDARHESLLDLTGLKAASAGSVVSAIRLDLSLLSETAGYPQLGIRKLRFFLNGEAAVVALIRELIFTKAVCVWISVPGSTQKIALPADAIRPVGFQTHELLLEPDVRTHLAYQLLLEYFVLPEKFNFFELDFGSCLDRLPPQTRRLELRIGLAGLKDTRLSTHLLDRVGADNFMLGCTPVVNLFRHNAEPIRIGETATAYPVIVDSRRPHAYEVHEIRRVFRVQQGSDADEVQEYRPFYSLKHGDAHDAPARYWHAHYLDDGEERNYTMEMSLVDSSFSALQPEASALSLDLMCTNRELPSQLPFGLADGDLFMEGGSVAKAIRFLRKPSPSLRFPRGRGTQWRLVSHLALNHLSLTGEGVDAIKEILTLYDISRSAANTRQIGGVAGIEQRPVTARIAGNPFPVFARGIEVRITIDEDHYAGIGIFMFAQILDHFFGLYVHANSFTQLVVLSRQSGQELIRCQPRNGASILA